MVSELKIHEFSWISFFFTVAEQTIIFDIQECNDLTQTRKDNFNKTQEPTRSQ